MSTLRAVLWPSPRRTQLLVEDQDRLILRASLAPMSQSHPAAVGALLEALALWQTSKLFAVLAVDDRAAASSSTVFQLGCDRVEVVECAVSRPRSADHLRQMIAHVQPTCHCARDPHAF